MVPVAVECCSEKRDLKGWRPTKGQALASKGESPVASAQMFLLCQKKQFVISRRANLRVSDAVGWQQ